MELLNQTPFATERVLLQDRNGRDVLVVVVKQTWVLDDAGNAEIADEQIPVQMADEYWGEPGESSVRYESDLVPQKLGTDVVLTGHACAPEKRPVRELDVSLQVGPLQKTVRVFGDRTWRRPLGLLRPSRPGLFDRMPLVYERAFGGEDLSRPKPRHHEWEKRNPVGRGLRVRRSKMKARQVPLPNLEDPSRPIKRRRHRPAPTGFGFIGRSWEPRLRLAGSYDAHWERTRLPLLPTDFDERYYNGAHPDLIAIPHLQGDESVEIRGARPDGPLHFQLPGCRPEVRLVTVAEERTDLQSVFDTLVLEPDERRFSMVWRASQDVYGGAMLKLRLIRVQTDV